MLVLSRKSGEAILVGNDVRVVVVDVSGGVVRLGIEAPRELNVVREEIHLEIRGENLRASGSVGAPETEGSVATKLRNARKKREK